MQPKMKPGIWKAIAKFLTPFGLGALLCFAVFLIGRGRYVQGGVTIEGEEMHWLLNKFAGYIQGGEAYWFLYLMMFAGFPLGRWSLSIGVFAGFNPLVVAIIGTMADCIVALFVLWNWNVVYGLPKIGKLLENASRKTEKFFEAHSGIEKGSFLGMIVFIACPLQIGGFYAGVVAKLVGIRNPVALSSILVGSFLGGLFVVYSVTGLAALIKSNLLLFLVVVGVLAAAAVVYYYFVRPKREKEGRHENKG